MVNELVEWLMTWENSTGTKLRDVVTDLLRRKHLEQALAAWEAQQVAKANVSIQDQLAAKIDEGKALANKDRPLKLEAGKYYRTRDGRKAFVRAIVQNNPFNGQVLQLPVQYFVQGDHENPKTCTLSGKFNPESVSGECPYDLVSEWHEPAKRTAKVYLVRHNSMRGEIGGMCAITTDPDLGQAHIIGQREVELVEGEGV